MTERVYLLPDDVAPSGSPRVSILWEPFAADNTGATDTSAAFNAANLAGVAVDIAPGTYRLDALADVSGARDFTGVGAGAVAFKLGAAGQLEFGQGGGASGGRIGGFEVDGQGVANVAGGGAHVAGRNSIDYFDMYVHGCLVPGMLIDGGQNNDFYDMQFGTPGGSEVSLVFDHAVGGLNFYGTELAGGMRVQQTHLDYSGGYFTWVGPSDIHFKGGRTEYPVGTKPLIYLAAGSNISLDGFGIAGSNSLVVMEPGAQNYPLLTAPITAWDGAFNITIPDATGLTDFMSVKVPNCPPETIINNVVGNVVTLSIAPSADPTGGTAQFGARMLDLTVDGSNGISGSGTSTAFDLRGNTTLIIRGRPTIQNHTNLVLQRHSDQAYSGAVPPKLLNVTNEAPQQQAGDTGTVPPVISRIEGQGQTLSRRSGDAIHTFQRDVDPYPLVAVTLPGLAFSDGTTESPNLGLVSLGYLNDSVGKWISVAGTTRGLSANILRAVGLAGFSTQIEFQGQFDFAGHPTGARVQGQCGVDTNGVFWFCIASGTPGTWVQFPLSDDIWTPSRQGLLAWNVPSTNASSVLAPSAGQLRLSRVYIPRTITVANIRASVTTGGTGVTALANCFMGLYDSTGARFATTADQSTAFATAGSPPAALTADAGKSLTITGGPGVYIWAALLIGTQSTTNVQMSCVSSNANNAINANVSPVIAGGFGSGLSALPTSFTPSSVGAAALFWQALS